MRDRLRLQRKPSSPVEHTKIQPDQDIAGLVKPTLSSPGHPLDSSVRKQMEPRFGHDFSQVQVHTDTQAADSAEAIQATAYTAGPHIVFGANQYAPETSTGQRLIAHELTHVIQQSTGPVTGTPVESGVTISQPSDHFEQAAESSADQVMAGHSLTTPVAPSVAPAATSTISLQRQAEDEEEEVEAEEPSPEELAQLMEEEETA